MKRIDFEHGTVTGNILGAALPMLVAQILNLLYNIVDRIYIARIPNIGTAALGAVGLCFPLIVVITAFSNLFGSGGAPLFSIYRGKGEPQRAANVMNTSFTMVCVCAVVLMAVGFIFARPLLVLFGASTDALVYAYPYLMIYLIGTLPSMIATGMNPFINAQGYSTIGMTSVAVGAVANLLLDPLFIFVLGFGVQGAAIATVISQALSAVFVFVFLTRKSELKVRFLKKKEFSECIGYAKNIVSLGTAGFIMQLTNPARVRKAMAVMSTMILGYTAVMWSIIILFPSALIGIFSSDAALMQDAVPALKQYFAAFICMDFQYIGQTVFKSLNKKKQAIFFSLLRKVFIVVPLTYMMPYMFYMGTSGVFLAEPVSNIIGGTLCLVVMLCTVLPELKRMEKQNSKNVLQ